MDKQIITLCYRKIIDVRSQTSWEKLVFEDTYTEFKMQAQLYNPEKKYSSFAELLRYTPGADKLHFLVSAAVVNYVKQLDRLIPDLTNTSGKIFLPFHQFYFEIINSDLRNKSAHSVAINFYSNPMVWHSSIGEHLLLSEKKAEVSNEIFTNLFQLRPFVNIHAIQNEL